MAEFQDVMRQAKRMCKGYKNCGGCPLWEEDGGCKLGDAPMNWRPGELREIDGIVMQWAVENPEPRYPSWEEWQDATFPDALCDICPRPFGFAPMDGCVNVSCDDCMSASIPADIADKLGIKPVGGDAG